MKVGAHIKRHQKACFPYPLPLPKPSQESSREDTMRRQHLQLKQAVLAGHWSWRHPDLRLLSSRTVRNPFPFRPSQAEVSYYGSWAEWVGHLQGCSHPGAILWQSWPCLWRLTVSKTYDSVSFIKHWKLYLRVHSPNALKCVVYYFYEFLTYLKTFKPGYLFWG